VAQIAVLIVDDQAPFRLAAAAVVEATAGFDVVGVAGSGEEAVLLAPRLHPDLVLMDVQLPGIDGWEATRLLTSSPSPPAVVVLSGGHIVDAEEQVRATGALCYLAKAAFEPRSLSRAWASARRDADPPAARPGT
jgi:DNA-binding NarL/FixJ family response regulator